MIDAHTHLMLGPKPDIGDRPHRPEDYLARVGRLALRHAMALTIAHRGRARRTRSENDAVLALGRSSHGRFVPLCSVHPFDGAAALREIDRVAEAGARGLKLHPNTQAFDVADERVAAVVARATDRHLPLLFDAYSPFDADQPGKFVRLALAQPGARLILAHALGTRFDELLVYEILARYPWWRRNVWIDLSATTALFDRGPFAPSFGWVLTKVGSDRLLFGSDYPLDDPLRAFEAVARLPFDRPAMGRIFSGNAAELFALE